MTSAESKPTLRKKQFILSSGCQKANFLGSSYSSVFIKFYSAPRHSFPLTDLCAFYTSYLNIVFFQYNVSGSIPSPGSGGEYNVQDGFGWTNGAVLDLLVTYADRITAQDPQLGNNPTTITPSTSTLTTSTATVESSHLIFAFLCARTIFAFFC